MPDTDLAHVKPKNMSQFSKLSRLALAGIIALVGMVAIGAVAAYSAPAKTNWLLTFTVTDKGSHIIGNPAAPVKLTEYMSYTCGHCASFESNDAPVLKSQYVATGKASFEIRNYVLNPVDLTAAMLARCGGKGRFFGNHKHLLATQKTWLGKTGKISKATSAKLQTEDYIGYMTGVYVETGLSAIMQQRGVTLAQGKACLADKAAFNTIIAMSDEGTKLGVDGTPSFLINGELQGHIHDFQSLKSKLN
jgi:protein-disulfide isomerase